jgi:hypothetical protein
VSFISISPKIRSTSELPKKYIFTFEGTSRMIKFLQNAILRLMVMVPPELGKLSESKITSSLLVGVIVCNCMGVFPLTADQ